MNFIPMPDRGTGSKRHGLFTVFPSRYDATQCGVDIVAIHGLNGHPFETWTDEDGHLWLRDSLPVHVPAARIMTFGYDLALQSTRTSLNIFDFAQDFLDRLSKERKRAEEFSRPLIFICHSLGGVVVKQALITAALGGDQYMSISNCTSGIVFLGTPHRGSREASQGLIVAHIFNAASVSNNVGPDLLQALEMNSPVLDNISLLALHVLSDISVVSFYEQEVNEATGKLIVEPFSAVLGLPNERAIPVNADHRGLSRVSPRKPQQYLPIWSSVKELVERSLLATKQDYEKMMAAIFCTDYKTAQLRPRQPHPSTCDWIFVNPIFRQWFDSSESSILLLSAPPGFGKTVIMRHVTEQVMAGQQLGWAGRYTNLAVSFFCSISDEALNSEDVVLRSLLHQLLQVCPRAQLVVYNTLAERDRFGSIAYNLETKRLWKAIQDLLFMKGMENILVSIDALEELGANHAHNLLLGFNKLTQHVNQEYGSNCKPKFLFSSRPNILYQTSFPAMGILHIQRENVEDGIKCYLQACVLELQETEPSFSSALGSHNAEMIVERLARMADGMFLWASLAWDNFKQGVLWNEEGVLKRIEELNSLPQGINALYDKVLARVDVAIRQDMWDLFALLAVAKWPMNESELSELYAIIVSRQPGIPHPNKIHPAQGLVNGIERYFPDLVHLHNDGTILFSHMSFEDYLFHIWKSEKPELLEKAKEAVARACLGYITHWDTLDGSKRSSGLCRYATRNHIRHLADLSLDDPLWLEYAKTAGSGYFDGQWKSPVHTIIDESWEWGNLLTIEQIHCLLRRLVAHGYDLNNRNIPEKRGALLNTCCRNFADEKGYSDMVGLLLKLGADPNLYPSNADSNLRGSLLYAGSKTKDALLNHPNFDPNKVDSHGQTALHLLIELGSETDAINLINKGVCVNIQDNTGNTPLHSAVALGKVLIIRRLLGVPGIRVDLIDKAGRTPLSLASWWGLKQIALIIIQESEAFPALLDDYMPFMNAARHGDEELTRALLPITRYKNINRVVDESGKSFLHHAAMNDWSTLLDHCLKMSDDTNVDQIDHSGRTALHYAAKLGCVDSCKVLLSYKARLNHQDRNGMNPVQLAADAGFKDVIMILLEKGRVDANQRDHQGRNLVHWLATIDCLDIMHIVCQQPGIEIARYDNSGKLPIDYAWSCQCQQVGRYLSLRMKNIASEVCWVDTYLWDMVYEVAAVKVSDAKNTESELRESSEREERYRLEEAAKYPYEQWGMVRVETREYASCSSSEDEYN